MDRRCNGGADGAAGNFSAAPRIDEERQGGRIADLDVSAGTPLAILRQALAGRADGVPEGVEVLVRVRRGPAPAAGGLLPSPPASAYSPGRPGRRPGWPGQVGPGAGRRRSGFLPRDH